MIRGWLEDAGAAVLGYAVVFLLVVLLAVVALAACAVSWVRARLVQRQRKLVRAEFERAAEGRVRERLPRQRDGER